MFTFHNVRPCLGGSVVSVSDSLPSGFEFEPTNLLSGVFPPLTSAEAREKSSWWLWKESCVSTDVRRPGNTVMYIIDRHDMTLAVKVVLTPVQPTNYNVREEFEG